MKTLRSQRVLSVLLALSGVGLSGIVSAATFDTIEALNQEQFIEFSEDLGAASHYRSVAPPEALGILGFDIGVAITSTDVSGEVYDLASGGDFSGSDLIVPKVQVLKGLPFGLNVGASLGVVPDSDATILGGELRFAIIDGGVLTPSVGVRATHSQVLGLDTLDFHTSAIELSISKGFLMLTPYAGVGYMQSKSTPRSIGGLGNETIEENKFFLGATINLGIALTFELDRTGDVRTYSAKAGIRF